MIWKGADGNVGMMRRVQGSRYALIVLFAINLMNFFDRQLLGAVGEGIRREWTLTDTALGLLGTVFTLLYAVVGLPLGRLSDRIERRKILAAGVFVWSVLTAMSGMARTFAQLVVARLGVGVGEATCSPASTSLIGDLVGPTMRARAVAIWMLGLPLGLGLANGAGGWILQNWGWRNAFYIAAIPGILCAVAALMMREPPRGARETHAVGDRRRRGQPLSPRVVDSHDPLDHRFGRVAQLQHVRARRLPVTVPGALSPHELPRRRMGRRRRLRFLRGGRAHHRRGIWLTDCMPHVLTGCLIVGTGFDRHRRHR